MKFIYLYIALINAVTFAYMGIDKRKAIHHAFRIPERVLFLLSLLGGSLGTLFGMFIFHHKTNKKQFLFGIPVLLILNIIVIFKLDAIFFR